MKKIIVEVGHNTTKAAILEDGQLVEFHVEKKSEDLVGNIYIGKVANVLPGMQAAFVDIGLGKNAFLYVSDALPANNEDEQLPTPTIREVLSVGQKLVVQVLKEPFGNKGPRVTTHISLPGRYIVYMPESNYIGVSRRIVAEEERSRLKNFGEAIKERQEGLIIRTNAQEASEEQIKRDLQFLRTLWDKTIKQELQSPVPSQIYRDLELVPRLVRDILAEDVALFVINNGYEYKKIKDMVNSYAPELSERLYLHSGKEDIFSAYNVQGEIDKLTKRKVWLKSGGYLIIDKTEALTVIDVNTGKYIGHSHLEDTVLKTNIEAAGEIAKQLRLRDIGGIIVIDFIDMERTDNREKVLGILSEEMKKDRTKSNIMGITQLGLVELTRKKVRQSLDTVLLRNCPVCDGLGRVSTEEEVFNKLERELKTYQEHTTIKALTIELHPQYAASLLDQNNSVLNRLEEISSKIITIKSNEAMHIDKYKIQFLLD